MPSLLLLAAALFGFTGAAAPALASAGACANEAVREEQGSTFLPDCRAYELVSPANKNGADVLLDTSRTRAAAGETPDLPSALSFSSLGAFADARGTGVANDYLSVRTGQTGSQGWATHAITPLQEPITLFGITNGQDPMFDGEFSPNLTTGIFRAWSPLTDVPAVANAENLYLRNDLRDPGAGSYALLSSSSSTVPPGLPSFFKIPKLAGTSADFRDVLFESRLTLTPDAPASQSVPKLYENVDGVVRYVAILPASEGGGPAPSSIAGQGAGAGGPARFTPHVISENGQLVFFTVPSSAGGTSGALYVRDDQGTADTADDTTARLNATERDTPDAPQDATYLDATPDGSRVFFMSSEALTNDATIGAGEQLYMYDTTKPDSDPHNLTLISRDTIAGETPGTVMGLLGLSNDGRTVYFLAKGQRVPGEPLLGDNAGIYAWKDGSGLSFIGTLDDFVDRSEDLVDQTWGLGLHQVGAQVTPDGRYLLFSSRQPPRPSGYDHGDCPENAGQVISGKVGCRELYLYDSTTSAAPVCVSCNPSGAPATSDAFFGFRLNTAASSTTHLNHAISDDGRYVFFTSGDALVAGDQNKSRDAYEYDTSDGSLHLLSSGKSTSDSYFMDASRDGHDVYFATHERLNGWDTDQNLDLYDARIDGGLPDPPVVPAACEGDSCRGPLSGPPGFRPPGTSGLEAPIRPPARRASVRVTKTMTHGATATLAIRVSGTGRLRISGTRVRPVSRATTKAATYRVRVKLTAKALRALSHHRRLVVALKITFAPSGASPVRAAARLTFRIAAHRRAGR